MPGDVQPGVERARPERALVTAPTGRSPLAWLPTGDVGPGPGATRRPRVLIVDDEPAFVRVCIKALERECDAEGVTRAARALELIADGDFDLILCDLQMPGMSGEELFQQARQQAPASAERFVFLTGARTPTQLAFLETVDNLQLQKPLDVPLLRDWVRQRLVSLGRIPAAPAVPGAPAPPGTAATPGVAATPAPPATSASVPLASHPAAIEASLKARVLLVEDEPALRRAGARILENAGYTVVQAADGREAMAALAGSRYDVIITDITMPGMTGTELLHAVRQVDPDIPVLLVTGNPTVESAVHAVENGAMRYLVKPVNADDLLDAVHRAATLRRIGRIKRESVDYLASLAEAASAGAARQANLRRALDTLWMAYQPIVDWRARRIVAYEALVRTNDPAVPHPGILFGLAQELGMLPEVGRAIRASVGRTLRERPPEVDLFVNLHPADFLDETLYGPDDPLAPFASRIVLEVTERAALDETAGIAARATRLRALGYRIAIDDLGAGYSGLSYLVQLAPEVVKIDMSLIRHVDREPVKQKLVGSLATLCKDLGMRVVAEGVETVAERDAVSALGCDQLQGYLFAKPGRPFPDVDWTGGAT